MKKVNEPTKRQSQILDYIIDITKDRGYPPSVREIGEACGLHSPSTVHMHLTQLEEKGFIRRDPTKPRAIEILHNEPEIPAASVITMPIVGRVAAGTPITATENTEGYFSVSSEFLGRGDHFILSVKGDSMIEAGILDGDMVIVRSQVTANNGDIVVAMLEDEATVKRYYRRPDYIELRPENQTLQPIIARNVNIAGIVCGLIRRM
ncbi:MAG: transcriptional repressor LexA [Solirubrobacterales bacterium]